MKKKEKQSLSGKNLSELNKMLIEKKTEYKRAVLTMQEEKNKNKAKNIKKDIARIKTVINAKEFENRVKSEKGGKNA